MQRLAVYTGIDGKIHTKYINFEKNTEFLQYVLKIPQGRVVLHKVILIDSILQQTTEVFVESDRDYLLRNPSLYKLAFETYSEDIIHESCYKI